MSVLDRAIVMGGSVAGLLAAAALAPHSRTVTIVDRDELPTDGPAAFGPRRSVPQAGTVHRLLALGEARMEQLLPGLREDLLAAGAAQRGAEDADPVLDAAAPLEGSAAVGRAAASGQAAGDDTAPADGGVSGPAGGVGSEQPSSIIAANGCKAFSHCTALVLFWSVTSERGGGSERVKLASDTLNWVPCSGTAVRPFSLLINGTLLLRKLGNMNAISEFF